MNLRIGNVGVILFVATLLLGGCASAPMASLEHDSSAKEFKPQPDKAGLYIYRSETMGMAFPMTVVVNGKTLGQTAAHTYFLVNVTPGTYRIESHAEDISTLNLTLKANKNYYVWEEVKMGMWSPRSSLQQVGDDAGQKGVLDSKLIATSISSDEIQPLNNESKSIGKQPDSLNQKDFKGSVDKEEIFHELNRLKELLDKGVINQSEFNEKKKALLEKL